MKWDIKIKAQINHCAATIFITFTSRSVISYKQVKIIEGCFHCMLSYSSCVTEGKKKARSGVFFSYEMEMHVHLLSFIPEGV